MYVRYIGIGSVGVTGRQQMGKVPPDLPEQSVWWKSLVTSGENLVEVNTFHLDTDTALNNCPEQVHN